MSEEPTSSSELQTIEGDHASTNMARFEYPSTFGQEANQWIIFNRYQYRKADIEHASHATRAEDSTTIALPIPAGLTTSYTATWQNENEGISGAQIANAEGAAVESMKKVLTGQSTGIDLTNIGAAVWGGSKQWVINNLIDAAFGDEKVQQAAQAAGYARNPYQAMVFQSPEFRQFQFSWKIFPANRTESDTIKKIYKEFKVGMAPSFATGFGGALGQNIFGYPDMWKFDFTDDSYLFKTAYCVLTNVTIDYHAEGTPLYFNADAKIPASMLLTCAFQETKILTKEDFENWY